MKLSQKAVQLRERLLIRANTNRAIGDANALIEPLFIALNKLIPPATVADSLLTRALLARALLQVGAQWWSDCTSEPMPETWAALISFIEDPPAAIEGRSWIDPKINETPPQGGKS